MAKHIDVSLDGLHQLLHRIERKELADGDWAICGALVLQLITKVQGQQDRMAAKLAKSGAASSLIDAVPTAAGSLPPGTPPDIAAAPGSSGPAGGAAPEPELGNKSTASIRVTVPHDRSSTKPCRATEGVDSLASAECRQ